MVPTLALGIFPGQEVEPLWQDVLQYVGIKISMHHVWGFRRNIVASALRIGCPIRKVTVCAPRWLMA